MHTKNNFEVIIGDNSKIDINAIIGYYPGKEKYHGWKKITDGDVIIGRDAVVRSFSIIYLNVRIGDFLEMGHSSIIMEDNEIGSNLVLGNNSCIDFGCKIGNNVQIHNNVYIAQYTVLEDGVLMAPGVVTCNDLCPTCTECLKGPTIKEGAQIGGGVTILPRVIIGEKAIIGAGSVVTKNINPEMIAYGNPAREIMHINDLRCKIGLRKWAYRNKGGTGTIDSIMRNRV
jgi:acetyltransferase-like isoleucine patch superfamily enzyme